MSKCSSFSSSCRSADSDSAARILRINTSYHDAMLSEYCVANNQLLVKDWTGHHTATVMLNKCVRMYLAICTVRFSEQCVCVCVCARIVCDVRPSLHIKNRGWHIGAKSAVRTSNTSLDVGTVRIRAARGPVLVRHTLGRRRSLQCDVHERKISLVRLSDKKEKRGLKTTEI